MLTSISLAERNKVRLDLLSITTLQFTLNFFLCCKGYMDASTPVARHYNLPNHSKHQKVVCSVFLQLGSSESYKTLEQKFIFQIGNLNLTVSTSAFHSTKLFLSSSHQIPTNSVALFSA